MPLQEIQTNNQLLLCPVINPDKNKLEEAYELTADFGVLYSEQQISVPKFFQYDGASIPNGAHPIIGTPFNPRFMKAAVVHDWIYHTHQISRNEADDLFFQMLIEDQVNEVKAVLMREAVQNFGGWYWNNDQQDLAYLESLSQKIKSDNRDPAKYGLT